MPALGSAPMSRRALSVKVPEDVQALIDALPNKSEWLRRVIVAAASQELQPAVEAIAPTVDPNPNPNRKERRSQKLSTSRPPSRTEPDELKPEQLIHNPAGWRGWVDKSLGGDRYQVTFENGLTDDYPRHLLRVQED